MKLGIHLGKLGTHALLRLRERTHFIKLSLLSFRSALDELTIPGAKVLSDPATTSRARSENGRRFFQILIRAGNSRA